MEEARIINAFEIMRDRQKRYGDVIIPKRITCAACSSKVLAQDMHRLKSTGFVKDVQDMVCNKCAITYRSELAKASRLVCAGCKEVIHVFEPTAEKNGFKYHPNTCYHVAKCPCCCKEKLEFSPILEKIAFYKTRGIPYIGAP